jgi:organic radical activating enzyme
MKTYSVNECFYSLQGEGARAGSPNVFLRFAGCNLQCVNADELRRPLAGNEINAGFFCDTDFRKGEKLSLEEVVELVKKTDTSRPTNVDGCRWVIATGGEPSLQLDKALIEALNVEGYLIAIETNGTRPLPYGLDWVSCSPKRGTEVRISRANEVRVVIGRGEEPFAHGIHADHYFVSPRFHSVEAELLPSWRHTQGDLDADDLRWAIDFCKANPKWKLSIQAHKVWGVR